MEEKRIDNSDVEATTVEEIGKNKIVVKFDKPYTFEGKSYTELDLSRMEQLTTNNLINLENLYNRSDGEREKPETTLLFTVIVVSFVCKLPFDFFGDLPAREAIKLKEEVNRFFQI